MATIYSIVYRPEPEAEDATEFLRIPLERARLMEGHGIEGDLKGGNPQRQLNIMTFETTETLREDGFKTEPGRLGEQIIIAGLDVYELGVGTLLRIGDVAEVLLLKQRNGCDKFGGHQGIAKEEAKNRLGMMAAVRKSGAIQIGDPVKVIGKIEIEPETEAVPVNTES
ncbi:MAG TPA: MOSC domain-containing protein [Aggregatilineales bacterium]|nr:MOSC domain-containing protein [Aggregatilineales bacterium]